MGGWRTRKHRLAANSPTRKKRRHDIFNLWVNASLKESQAAVFPASHRLHVSPDEAADARNTFLDAYRATTNTGWAFDCNAQQFVEFYKEIDVPIEHTFYTHMPLGADAVIPHNPSDKPKTLHYNYNLYVIHPTTIAQNHPQTVDILSKWLVRRYYGAVPKKVVIITASDYAESPKTDALILHIPDASTLGIAYNMVMMQAMAMTPDLIVLDIKGGALIDKIIPAYPIVVNNGVIVMTPIQLAQINGVSPHASTPDAVFVSVLGRIAVGLGAILCTNKITGLTIEPDAAYYLTGINSLQTEGLLTDGRVTLVDRANARFIPTLRHGWLSYHTHTMLQCGIDQLTAGSTVLELGSWYGKFSAFILKNAPAGITFYAADYFKNNAEYDAKMWKLGPLDKMFLRHLRYETFQANVAPHIRDGTHVYMMKMDIYAAVELVASGGTKPAMILIDAEKATKPLVGLLRKLREYFPEAIIVGDDYVFASVRAAVAEVGAPFTFTYEGGYVIYPHKASYDMGRRSFERWKEHFAPFGLNKHILELVNQGKWREALAGGNALHQYVIDSDAEFLHQHICKTLRANPDELGELWPLLFGDCYDWKPPYTNHSNLTPFDYLAHNIRWS